MPAMALQLFTGLALLLLTLPALAQTSEREAAPVEVNEVYQVSTPNAPAASPAAQAPTVPQPAAKPPTSIVVPVDSKTSNGCAPAYIVPPSSAAVPCASSDQWPNREGFYLRLAYGPGFAKFRGQGPHGAASISGLSSSTAIAIGGSLTRGLVLAGTLQSTQTTARFKGGPFMDASIANDGSSLAATDRASASLSDFGVMVDWYPRFRYGLHSGLMAGLGTVSVTNLADNSSFRGQRLATSIFVGYDWSLSRYWSIGLELLGSGATKASLRAGRSRVDSGYELAPVAFGLAATIVYF